MGKKRTVILKKQTCSFLKIGFFFFLDGLYGCLLCNLGWPQMHDPPTPDFKCWAIGVCYPISFMEAR